VPGPDRGGVGNDVEQAPEAAPFETRVPLACRAANLPHKEQIAGHEQLKRGFVDDQVIVTVSGGVHDAECESPHREFLAVRKRDRRRRGTGRMRRHGRAGQLGRSDIAVDVIRVPVRVDDVQDPQTLVGGALNEDLGRVRGVDENTLAGRPVTEKVPEIPIAAGADLFEDELHLPPAKPLPALVAFRAALDYRRFHALGNTRMKPFIVSLAGVVPVFVVVVVIVVAIAPDAYAQQAPFDRLPSSVFDILPPPARVQGAPGAMTIRQTSCRNVPAAQVRRRIVELAVQEWAFFGFTIADQTEVEGDDGFPRRSRRPGDAQSARVAASIAGYWTVAPGGDWIIGSQNKIWNGLDGGQARWRFPWSAAFVSWVMCEGGLRDSDQFQRAIAHHTYIDQAIRARDRSVPRAAFVAYNAGEAAIAPGDLLCSSRRPAYSTLDDRRRQMGTGARTHCDIVVKVEPAAARILAIGGNVRGTIGLKILPAVNAGGVLRLADGSQIRRARPVFAHLKLRAAQSEGDAFDTSPTIKALACAGPWAAPARGAASRIVSAAALRCTD
jgi:hypothetical protein